MPGKKKETEGFSYTNRKGQTYYLHEGRTKLGKPKLLMTIDPKGAKEKVPEGYEIVESINAVVSVKKVVPSKIPADELDVVQKKVAGFRHLKEYRVAIQGNAIVIYQPIGLGGIKEIQKSDSFSMLKQFESIAQMLGRDSTSFFREAAERSGMTLAQLRQADIEFDPNPERSDTVWWLSREEGAPEDEPLH